jgi:NAD(P)-dependent dehydrogenase (short-subunit alcohol dehydrogenase family)
MVSTNVFLPTANPTHAAIIGITAAVVLPVQTTKGLSAYVSSKLSLIKVMEYIAAENPNVFAAALHPGMVDTKILRESGADPNKVPLDSGKCPTTAFLYQAMIFNPVEYVNGPS